MKTIYLITKFILLVYILLAILSCDGFVEVELPKSQLTNAAVFEDYTTADAALTDIYANIRDNGMLSGSGFGISNQLGNYTDELICNQSSNNISLPFYNNALLPSTTAVAGYWNSAYNQIYAANSIIEGAQASTALSGEQKKQLTGQAIFIRGLLHFYLVNLFGDVPYITSTDYKKNSTASRLAASEVYKKIILDLQSAMDLLPVSDGHSQRVRPDMATAAALLSRVYLYNGAYPEAANSASSLINADMVYTLEDVDSVFLNTSKETIWQLQSGEPGRNTQEAAFFVFTSGPPSQVCLTGDLVGSFSSSDLRKTSWIKEVTNGGTTWYHANKYKENNTTPASREYSIVLRLSEQYLIRAEARALQGDLIGAREDLDKIRHRAGLADSPAVTQAQILTAILQERRWEFFTERGHRFFDLKRLGLLDSTLSGVKAGWNTTDRLFPIPQTELSTNPNLRPQNPGY